MCVCAQAHTQLYMHATCVQLTTEARRGLQIFMNRKDDGCEMLNYSSRKLTSGKQHKLLTTELAQLPFTHGFNPLSRLFSSYQEMGHK